MAKFNFGTAGYIGWIYAGGTTALLPNYTEMSFDTTAETADTTSGALTWDTHIDSRRNYEISATLFFDNGSTNGTADFSKLTVGEKGVWFFGPQGTATGAMKYGGSVTVTAHNMAMPFAEPVTLELTLQGNGTPYWNHGSAF